MKKHKYWLNFFFWVYIYSATVVVTLADPQWRFRSACIPEQCNKDRLFEPGQEIPNNVVCATSMASDQPAHTRSLIRAVASRLNILWVSISYWLNTFGVSKLKRRLHRLVWVYTCQNATWLEITCRGSFLHSQGEQYCDLYDLHVWRWRSFCPKNLGRFFLCFLNRLMIFGFWQSVQDHSGDYQATMARQCRPTSHLKLDDSQSLNFWTLTRLSGDNNGSRR